MLYVTRTLLSAILVAAIQHAVREPISDDGYGRVIVTVLLPASLPLVSATKTLYDATSPEPCRVCETHQSLHVAVRFTHPTAG